MDIAAFVGFAARGPIHIPVAVEDATHFESIFGADLPLAWDDQRGEIEKAFLGPAVRAFFRNGGRRAWVVRVAGPAKSAIFPIPGLLRLREDGSLAPAFARARSEGSWADALQVEADVLSQPIRLLDLEITPLRATLQAGKVRTVQTGDLLKITFRKPGETALLLFAVESLEMQGNQLMARSTKGIWLQVPQTAPSPGIGRARLWGPATSASNRRSWVVAYVPPELEWLPGRPVVQLALAPDLAPEIGSFVEVDLDGQRLWMVVQGVRTVQAESPMGEIVQVEGEGLWHIPDAPLLSTDSMALRYAERLSLVLTTQVGTSGNRDQVRSGELGFAPQHPAYWGALPTDERLFLEALKGFPQATGLENPYHELWQTVADPRFPLAGYRPKSGLTFPLPVSPGLPSRAICIAGDRLTRDGLADFDARLFLDAELATSGSAALLANADFIRYQRPVTRHLTGIHAALEIEEATLIAVPDAVHRGWKREEAAIPSPEVNSPVKERACPPETDEAVGEFVEWRALGAPRLAEIQPPVGDAPYTIAWSPGTGPVEQFALEEASRPDFVDGTVIYTGPERQLIIAKRSPGAYFYRVRAEGAVANGVRLSSSPSNIVGVQVGASRPWHVARDGEWAKGELLKIQAGLLKMCAARSDLFAVLALPAAFREDDALAHVVELGLQFSDERDRILSFAALYHPWAYTQEESGLPPERYPPDGAMCGLIARRTLARGAWLAPANELVRGGLAADPPISTQRWLDLQEGSVNLIRREPAGLMPLSANTLSRDPDLRLINVRRLLILLRRLALREGATFVFEPNSPAFRRQVQRSFELLLGDLFARGAFGGPTPDTSYQVDASATVNPPAGVDAGRFVVEIRVSPSVPLSFLSIRLVHTGERGLQIQEL